MKLQPTYRNLIVNIICYLYILLFVYAAVSKLTDFQNFRLQIAQSPLLTAYAGFVAVAVLVAEFGISVLLSVPRFRKAGLYAAFTLMVLFSVYIFIILNYSPYVPCSCGGILEKMGWKEHLIFNLVFVLLAASAVMLYQQRQHVKRRVPFKLLVLTVLSAVIMTILFLTSENILQHRNNFVRRIPPFAVAKANELQLGYNSYYIAGADNANVYLGNIMTPSLVTVVDSALNNKRVNRIMLDDTGIDFKLAQVKVRPPYFYVYDGAVPAVFTGSIIDWQAKLKVVGTQYFTAIAPIDTSAVIFRAATKQYGNLLGTFNFGAQPLLNYEHGLLQKQIDGYFDTDGTMQYDAQSERFVYLYYYRNEYIVTDRNLRLIHRGNTIDTTTRAKIKIGHIEKTQQRKFAAPPAVVNDKSALRNNLLFVHSNLAGKYDPEVMMKTACIVDVYDFNMKTYLMSFYVYKVNGRAMDGFVVTNTHLFALFDKTLVSYRLHPFLKKYYTK